jgi:hypothetical protein
MITGIGVHDRPESVFTINWIGCSQSNGISVHDPPERAEKVYPSGQHRLAVMNRPVDLNGACKCVVKDGDDRWDGDNHRV